jgi:formylglycine-generating enzyme required for sulfatase activity
VSSPCPPEELLVAFAEGQCPPAQLAGLHEHLDGCGLCRTLVAELAEPAPEGPAPAPAEPPLGGVPIELDEYQLLRPLGQGAMGTVYLAHDTVLDRQVAIKWIAMIEPSAAARSRFLLEARAIARLQHPNVASVYRVGQIDGRPYLVCEYVRGESLDRLAKPVPWERLLQLALGLSRGLDAAHRGGVLHRDLKPANAILADSGEVKLLDFGLAKLLPHPAAPAVPVPPSVWLADFATTPPPLKESGVLGTPLYMAPELWRGEPATPRADLYSLGALLYELATGQPPVPASSLEQLQHDVQHKDIPPTAELAPTLEPRFAALIDRCLHRDPAQRLASAEQLAQELALLPLAELAPLPGGNPYRGLAAFDAEHRALFYGRGTEIRAVFELLLREPLVVVSGDSGVGKSSLCRAGVLPLCEDGGLAGGRTWTTVTLVPGQHPLAGLAAALAGPLATAAEQVRHRLAAPAQLAAELTACQAGRTGLCLFVDQLEELVSTSDPDEAATFTQTLRALADGARGVRVLAALRGDFLARVAALPGLGELVRGLYLLRPLTASGLREVIVNPARVRGVAFESEALVTELVHETLHAEGGLPLLSFALAELWEARAVARRTIPATALYAIGGVEGALARHADALLQRLRPAERAAARRLLGKLVTVEGLRVRRSEADLCPPELPAARIALEALLRGRLLVARVVDGASVYEIAHESLVSGWGTLRTWLAESREARGLQQRLEQAVTDWERLGHSGDALWGGRQLAEARPLLPALELSRREQEFLEAAQRQLRARLWAQRGLFLLALGLLLLYGGASYQKRRDENIRVNQQLAQARLLLTSARASRETADELQRQALAAFDQKQREKGEPLWADALAARAAAESDYGAATQTLETALQLAPEQPPVRALLSTILAERALLADKRGQLAHRDELVRRLRVYDAAGAAYSHLTGPVALHLGSTPPGALVTLTRYQKDAQGRRTESTTRSLGPTPLAEPAVEQGAYILTLTAAERSPVRYPLLVGREPVRLHVELPRLAAVPPGMVYVPAGKSLFGSTAPEPLRRHRADPLHPLTTGPYLIAERETTFGEYLTYLRALPPAERAARLPRAGAGLAGVQLGERADGTYELTLQAGGEVYRAREGELLHYQGRAQRAAQDWRRFPVVGLSFADAQAYVQWLAETRRLPGARLCSEQEWERAARGADDREYPHGDSLAPADANFGETYEREPRALGPDEVGSHPASRSPLGLYDMVGNAEEWVRPPTAKGCCLLRGCGFAADPAACALGQRSEVAAATRAPSQGLRLCASYPAP